MARMRVGGEIAASVKKTSASTVAKKHRTRKTSHHGRDPWSRAHLGGQQDDVQVSDHNFVVPVSLEETAAHAPVIPCLTGQFSGRQTSDQALGTCLCWPLAPLI